MLLSPRFGPRARIVYLDGVGVMVDYAHLDDARFDCQLRRYECGVSNGRWENGWNVVVLAAVVVMIVVQCLALNS